MQQKFMQDLQKIYDELSIRQQELNNYFKLLKGEENIEAKELVDKFLESLNLPYNEDTLMATLIRVVNLREDSLEQVLKKMGFSSEEIIYKKEIAYRFVRDFYLLRHEYFIAWIEVENLLTPFYQVLIEGVHNIGEVISKWQVSWTSKIINGVNRELLEEFKTQEAVLEMLQNRGLLDLDPSGFVGDRCYSVLERDERGEYRSVAYSNAFREEVGELVSVIEDCIENLSVEEDRVFNQKEAWIEYFVLLKKAFSATEPKKLIGHWANVDRAWMQIKTPLQVGHPLEYYEDHFRKAVALEWDLRIVNPKLQSSLDIKENMKRFVVDFSKNLEGDGLEDIVSKNLDAISRTQLYIGKPMLFYGAEFNGLFSAQVVPNDEVVSAEFGKKIFAYADFVLESAKAKPIMQIGVEFFGVEFIRKRRELLDKNPALWHKIYQISTIGHEFGHILWIDDDSETLMNRSGAFKNIEEFKATTGGLVSFFSIEDSDISLREHIIDDLVSRAVSLIAWQEVGEVLPYYCEGLIHLDILFKSGIVKYTNRVEIDYSRYETLKDLYIKTYRSLAQHYINKDDALLFLDRYLKREDGVYLPLDTTIRDFVNSYYSRYKEIGQRVYKEELELVN
jgi:hypothetical protein